MKNLKKNLLLLIVSLLFGVLTTASASTIYTDETVFLGSADPLSMESFESQTATNSYTTNSIALTDFTLSHSIVDHLGVYDSSSGWGGIATDGDNFIIAGSGNGTTVTLDFNSAINSFGINVTDWGDFGSGSLIFRNDIGESYTIATSSLPNNNVLFFGIINSDFSFISVDLVNSISGEAYAIDEVYYGNTSPVPEPTTILLFGLGLLGLTGVNRKKRQ